MTGSELVNNRATSDWLSSYSRSELQEASNVHVPVLSAGEIVFKDRTQTGAVSVKSIRRSND